MSPADKQDLKAISRRLIDQHDEPWPEGTTMDRLHYWRDKAIIAANAINDLIAQGEA